MKTQFSKYIVPVITFLVGLGIGGFAGMKYQQSQTQSGSGRGRFTGNGMNMMNRARGVTGEIISQDDKSITVKMTDGSTKIIFLSDSTVFEKTDTSSKGDLKTGVKVAVFGTTNSDGSVTAQNIQINPLFSRNP